jgi:hypothetical protein
MMMDLAFWRDVAIVLLALHLFVLLILPAGLLFLGVRGMQFVHRKLPPLYQKAQEISAQIPVKADGISNKVAEPVVRGHRWASQTRAVVHTLWRERG